MPPVYREMCKRTHSEKRTVPLRHMPTHDEIGAQGVRKGDPSGHPICTKLRQYQVKRLPKLKGEEHFGTLRAPRTAPSHGITRQTTASTS